MFEKLYIKSLPDPKSFMDHSDDNTHPPTRCAGSFKVHLAQAKVIGEQGATTEKMPVKR